MARLGLYMLFGIVFNIYMQADGVPITEPIPVPWVDVSHIQLCKQSVSQISQDTQYGKRDDPFVDLVVNVCFPGVHQETLLNLISMLSELRPAAKFSTVSQTETGQEGLEDAGVIVDTDELPNQIDNLLPETGPGQEGVENDGPAAEDTDHQDWADDDWWNGTQPVAETKDAEQLDNDLQNAETKWTLLKLLISSLKTDGDNESTEEIVTTMTTTTEGPIVTTETDSTTEEPIVTTETDSTTEEPKSTTEMNLSVEFERLFSGKRREELIALLSRNV